MLSADALSPRWWTESSLVSISNALQHLLSASKANAQMAPAEQAQNTKT